MEVIYHGRSTTYHFPNEVEIIKWNKEKDDGLSCEVCGEESYFYTKANGERLFSCGSCALENLPKGFHPWFIMEFGGEN